MYKRDSFRYSTLPYNLVCIGTILGRYYIHNNPEIMTSFLLYTKAIPFNKRRTAYWNENELHLNGRENIKYLSVINILPYILLL